MKKIIGIILVLLALALGYFGYQSYEKSHADIKIGSLELSADKGDSTHWFFWGAGIVCVISGAALIKK